jgi:hypothetical protein
MFACQELLDDVRNNKNFLSRVINRRHNLGLLLRPKNKTAVLSVEKPVLSTPEESEASQAKHIGLV